MKTHLVVIAAALAALCPAGETSPFYLPIRNNDLAALKQLIRDPGPAASDARGNSPLMYAAALGRVESMRLLLDAGADPNIGNKFDATPLMWCAGDAAKVRLLLSKGAKVDTRSKLGRTALLIAAYNDGAIEAAGLLLEKGADVDARDKSGASVLALAASDPIYRRGVQFLVRTQEENGTWHVVTRALGFQPYFQSGFQHDHDQWISQAGTAMATIALTFAAK